MTSTQQTQLLNEAKIALSIAQNHFDFAEKDFVDVATYQLTAAIIRFDAVYSRLKKFCPNELDKDGNRGKAC